MEKIIVKVEVISGPGPKDDIEGEWDISGYGFSFNKDAVESLNLKRVVRWEPNEDTPIEHPVDVELDYLLDHDDA